MSHEFRFFVDSDGVQLDCVCQYDPTDETRPCWPWDIERDEPSPLPAPQSDCTFTDWVDNDGIECLDVPVEVRLDLVAHRWESGMLGLEFRTPISSSPGVEGMTTRADLGES